MRAGCPAFWIPTAEQVIRDPAVPHDIDGRMDTSRCVDRAEHFARCSVLARSVDAGDEDRFPRNREPLTSPTLEKHIVEIVDAKVVAHFEQSLGFANCSSGGLREIAPDLVEICEIHDPVGIANAARISGPNERKDVVLLWNTLLHEEVKARQSLE
jgi:hypothetical protein